ncbi:MAG: hypothetical protein QG554_698, partial [Pseudomonadota bacterium]|nr:hypothetical protein [Pseudomonadota bacterium]
MGDNKRFPLHFWLALYGRQHPRSFVHGHEFRRIAWPGDRLRHRWLPAGHGL